MLSSGIEYKTTNTVQIIQMRQEQTTAFLLVFQAKYFKSKAMAKYMFAIKASMDTRLRIIKSLSKKLVMIARVFPLNQLVSQTDQNRWSGKLMAAFRRSTIERFAIRMFGTLRNDLKRWITARIEPFPSKATTLWRPVKALITTWVENGFDRCILLYVLFTVRTGVLRYLY